MKETINNVEKKIEHYKHKPYKSMAEIEKDLKYLGYQVKEVVRGEYIQFLDEKGDSYLLFVSDRPPYTIIEVDNDVVV